MAIRECILIKRTGKEQLTGGKRVCTYQSVYKLLSTIRNENPITVREHPEVPALGSGWPGHPGALCISRDPQPQSNAEEWLCTLDYTNYPDFAKGQGPDQVKENPTDRPASISRKPNQRQRIITRDAYDQLIVNTAGEAPNPPVEVEEHSPGFTITKNMFLWPYAAELAFTDSINLNDIAIASRQLVYPAYTVKFNGFSGSEKWENGFKFWEVSGDFEVNWQGWNRPIVSAGYNEKYTDELAQTFLWPIIGANGERPANEVLLDENGRADPYRSSPVLLDYRKHRELNQASLFALFGLTA